MSSATLDVVRAGPLVTIQDGGRPGLMRFGVPASGPMDSFAHAAANIALERLQTSTAIEVSLGGLTVRCATGRVTVAVCGGEFHVQHNRKQFPPWSVISLEPGDELSLNAGRSGSWCYLAMLGDLRSRRWLGSASTHVRSGLGGGAVNVGDDLVLDDAMVDFALDGPIEIPVGVAGPHQLRVVLGPQLDRFAPGAVDTFLDGSYRLTSDYDRMGVRLDGPTLKLFDALAIPSSPIVRGSLQVSGDGVPTLLFADHQTTGGYPKIATVITDDAIRATQLRAGDAVGFTAIDPATAVALTRTIANERARQLTVIAKRRGPWARQLLATNLISGIYHPHADGAIS